MYWMGYDGADESDEGVEDLLLDLGEIDSYIGDTETVTDDSAEVSIMMHLHCLL